MLGVFLFEKKNFGYIYSLHTFDYQLTFKIVYLWFTKLPTLPKWA